MLHRSLALSLAVVASVTGFAAAQSREPVPHAQRPVADGDWEYSLTPYLWFPSVGNADFHVPSVGAGGLGGGGGGGSKGSFTDGAAPPAPGADFNVEDDSSFFSDIGISPNVCFQVRGRPWTFYLDVRYLNQDADGETSADVDASLDFEAWMGEVGAAFELACWDTDSGGQGSWEVFAGLRGTSLDTEIRAEDGTQIDICSEWLDLMVGTRASCEFTPGWSVDGSVAIGGFGIAESNDFTWEVYLGVSWAATTALEVDLGYRVMGWHRDENEVDFDLVFHGPSLGVTFRF